MMVMINCVTLKVALKIFINLMESVLGMMSIVNTSDFPEILNIFKTETGIFVTVKVHYVHVCFLYF